MYSKQKVENGQKIKNRGSKAAFTIFVKLFRHKIHGNFMDQLCQYQLPRRFSASFWGCRNRHEKFISRWCVSSSAWAFFYTPTIFLLTERRASHVQKWNCVECLSMRSAIKATWYGPNVTCTHDFLKWYDFFPSTHLVYHPVFLCWYFILFNSLFS